MPFAAHADQAPPVLDFSGTLYQNILNLSGDQVANNIYIAFRSPDEGVRERLVQDIQSACKDKGFFQIVNHGVTSELQQSVFNATRNFFALPDDEKAKVQKTASSPFRGYEGPGVQRFEVVASDTKESFYLCKDKNLYPELLGEKFRAIFTEYFERLFKYVKLSWIFH